MSNKVRVFYPKYQLRQHCCDLVSERSVKFRYHNVLFVTSVPFFGATETQKAVLEWASWRTPPVICIKHEKPIASDREVFQDPNELHRIFSPYAMAIATLECLGEEKPRQIKVYFCTIALHEHNEHHKIDSHSQGTFVVPLW